MPITSAAYDLAKDLGYYDEKPQAEIGILQLSLPSADTASIMPMDSDSNDTKSTKSPVKNAVRP